MKPVAIKKRDGSLDEFNLETLAEEIYTSARDVGGTDKEKAKKLAEEISSGLDKKIVTPDEIEETTFNFLLKNDYDGTGWAYHIRCKRRKRARERVSVLGSRISGKDTTDAFLTVGSDSKETAARWDKKRIVTSLINEANVNLSTATSIADEVETYIFSSNVENITTHLIREAVHTELIRKELKDAAEKYRIFGIPRADLEQIIFGKNVENSNIVANNPEAINFTQAGGTLKAYALSAVFSQDVADAHTSGMVHLHDLDMPTRNYCSGHSLEYLKKYGLHLLNLQTSSGTPKHFRTLTGHLNTFFSVMQTYYAGALGVGYMNVFTAPLAESDLREEGKKKIALLKRETTSLKESRGDYSNLEKRIRDYEKYPISCLTEKEIDDYLHQEVQQLIFTGSQNAFSRGGQTLFLDFNIHTGVPKHMEETLAIGSGGGYQLKTKDEKIIQLEERRLKQKTSSGYNLMELIDPRTKEVVLREKIVKKSKKKKEELVQDEFTKNGDKILKYKDYDTLAKKITKATLDIWRAGDEKGAPFAFPKCDIHVSEETYKDTEQLANFKYATLIASENGSPYFVFDRDDVTMSACCRLRTVIDDNYSIKHPETMRFCGFQNVTINLPQAAYRAAKNGKKNLEGFLEEIDSAMDIAVKAHLQKKEFIKKLQRPGSPQWQTGMPSEDGQPYIDLDKATYIIGLIGLNEALQHLTGKELHELSNDEFEKYGLKTIAHMSIKAKKYGEKLGLKINLEESPAESASRRLSMVDLARYKEAKDLVKGSIKDDEVYYTNSIHLTPDASVGLIPRIERQSMFHSAIESGAIIHAFVGEKRPSPKSIENLITKTFKKTQAAQLVISPEFTICNNCETIHNGLDYDVCPKCESEDIDGMTRIVGYYSLIRNWNKSKVGELKDRQKGVYDVDSDYIERIKLKNDTGKVLAIEIGKEKCDVCDDLVKAVNTALHGPEIKKLNGDTETRMYKVDSEEGLTKMMLASMNPSRLPALIILDPDSNEIYRGETVYHDGKADLITAGKIVPALAEYFQKNK